MATPSPSIVAAIKQSLLDGATPSSLARLYGLNVETVRRYGRGESRQSVVVEGEEHLRSSAEAARVPEMAAGASASLKTLKKLLENQDGPQAPDSRPSAAAPALLAPSHHSGESLEPRHSPGHGNFLDE